jgi:glycosyltransferase involved in cell wall biosynthesis
MKLLQDVRVGYVPASESLQQPMDRRRFCYYARKRGLRFEIARPSEAYDVVIVTASGDVSTWSRYAKGGGKVIYEQLDAYFAEPGMSAKSLLRGIAKFALRQNRRLLLNYTEGLREMCRRADAVICTTAEQRADIEAYCRNVHVILDFQGDAVRSAKRDYRAGEIFHLVWEGLPHNLVFLNELRDVLRAIQRTRKIALHVIAALRYGKYLHGRVAQRRAEDEVRQIFEPSYTYAWNEQTCSAISTSCDLAVIPIPLGNSFASGKPENKLVFFWRLGVPTVVSATNAYVRAMGECGLKMACRTAMDWQNTLERYMNDEHARREAGERGRAFVERTYGEERLLAQWDAVFASVLGRSTARAEVNLSQAAIAG